MLLQIIAPNHVKAFDELSDSASRRNLAEVAPNMGAQDVLNQSAIIDRAPKDIAIRRTNIQLANQILTDPNTPPNIKQAIMATALNGGNVSDILIKYPEIAQKMAETEKAKAETTNAKIKTLAETGYSQAQINNALGGGINPVANLPPIAAPSFQPAATPPATLPMPGGSSIPTQPQDGQNVLPDGNAASAFTPPKDNGGQPAAPAAPTVPAYQPNPALSPAQNADLQKSRQEAQQKVDMIAPTHLAEDTADAATAFKKATSLADAYLQQKNNAMEAAKIALVGRQFFEPDGISLTPAGELALAVAPPSVQKATSTLRSIAGQNILSQIKEQLKGSGSNGGNNKFTQQIVSKASGIDLSKPREAVIQNITSDAALLSRTMLDAHNQLKANGAVLPWPKEAIQLAIDNGTQLPPDVLMHSGFTRIQSPDGKEMRIIPNKHIDKAVKSGWLAVQ
jgi:hypothetical protein